MPGTGGTAVASWLGSGGSENECLLLRQPEELCRLQHMFTTMDRIRVKLLDIVHSKTADPAKSQRIATALNQIMDLELAIMLETYRKDLVERTRNTIEVFSSPAE